MSKTTYRSAGVDTQAGAAFVSFIKEQQSQAAARPENIPRLYKSRTDFAALMDISFLKEYRQPLLVSAADGVGTKLHLAQLFDYHKTVGTDLVAMCVNDLLCSGARPIQFLDYIACGRLNLTRMQTIMASIIDACSRAGCTLAGGETAEHPDTMAPEQYDLGGFALGIVEREQFIDGSRIKAGDVLIGLPSSGIHSNGLSLVRRLYLKGGLELTKSSKDRDFLFNEILTKATLIYEPVVRPLLTQKLLIKGLVHITGGGFFENIPRILREDQAVEIHSSAWETPELFLKIGRRARLSLGEMLHTFNMGIGMIAFVAQKEAAGITKALETTLKKNYPEIDKPPRQIGKVVARLKPTESLTLIED